MPDTADRTLPSLAEFLALAERVEARKDDGMTVPGEPGLALSGLKGPSEQPETSAGLRGWPAK